MTARQPIELVRAWYATRDRALWAEDAVWELPEGFPRGGIYRGTAVIFGDFFPRLMRDWSEWRAASTGVFDSGDHVVGQGTYHGRCNATGREVAAPFVHLFRAEAGRLVFHRSFVDVPAFAAAMRSGGAASGVLS